MDYVQCEDKWNVQPGFFDCKLLQGIGLGRSRDVLERAHPALGGLLAIVGMRRTRSGGTIGEMNGLADLFFQCHLAKQSADALLDCGIVQPRRGLPPEQTVGPRGSNSQKQNTNRTHFGRHAPSPSPHRTASVRQTLISHASAYYSVVAKHRK